MMYVIQTKPKQEDYLLWQLKHIGINAYCPAERLTIRSKGKWFLQEKKIFSGYIFIETEYSAELYQKIRRKNGFIRFLGEPSELPQNEAEQINYLCNNGKPITSSKYIKNRNSFVFVSGILSKTSDFKIEKIYPRQKRAKISVSINGKNFKVFLPIEKSEL